MRRLYFTLVELLIVLTIVAMGASLTGVKIYQVYKEQRFFSETQQVLSHLAIAQDLMLIMDTDVAVHLAHDPQTKDFAVWLAIEKPVNESWRRLFERKLSLPSIETISFNERVVNGLTLQFTFGSMTKGTLELFDSADGHATIDLPGFPRPFGLKNEKQDQERNPSSQTLYPVEVYEKLYMSDAKKN